MTNKTTQKVWADYEAMSEVELWREVAEATEMAEELRDELATGRRFREARQAGEGGEAIPPEELAQLSVSWEFKADMALIAAMVRRYRCGLDLLAELGRGDNGYLLEAEISFTRPDPPRRPTVVKGAARTPRKPGDSAARRSHAAGTSPSPTVAADGRWSTTRIARWRDLAERRQQSHDLLLEVVAQQRETARLLLRERGDEKGAARFEDRARVATEAAQDAAESAADAHELLAELAAEALR